MPEYVLKKYKPTLGEGYYFEIVILEQLQMRFLNELETQKTKTIFAYTFFKTHFTWVL